ncbi:MAG: dihydropteroate synthase [Alphaproteobacteria bacterium]|nr:dihydropteroate synthase [Alphaproteobacteria bacterium]
MFSSIFGSRPAIMGIVNVTPDSFSDGGCYIDANAALAHIERLWEDGAAIVDIGGESTRPGSEPVSVQEEIDRVCPVIERVKDSGKWISIDSRNPQTMRAALKAGANIVNDVYALRESGAIEVVAQFGVPVCLMHMQGEPKSMQQDPRYENVVEDVFQFLHERIVACVAGGIDKSHIFIDPGIGFGKTLEHNLLLLRNIRRFHDLCVPVLLGASRKSFIREISPKASVDKRLPGSLAVAAWAVTQGVDVLRVHDVFETRQALDVFLAISQDP